MSSKIVEAVYRPERNRHQLELNGERSARELTIMGSCFSATWATVKLLDRSVFRRNANSL